MVEVERIGATVVADASQYIRTMTVDIPAAAAAGAAAMTQYAAKVHADSLAMAQSAATAAMGTASAVNVGPAGDAVSPLAQTAMEIPAPNRTTMEAWTTWLGGLRMQAEAANNAFRPLINTLNSVPPPGSGVRQGWFDYFREIQDGASAARTQIDNLGQRLVAPPPAPPPVVPVVVDAGPAVVTMTETIPAAADEAVSHMQQRVGRLRTMGDELGRNTARLLERANMGMSAPAAASSSWALWGQRVQAQLANTYTTARSFASSIIAPLNPPPGSASRWSGWFAGIRQGASQTISSLASLGRTAASIRPSGGGLWTSLFGSITSGASSVYSGLSGVAQSISGVSTQFVRMLPGGNTAISMLGQLGLSAGASSVAILGLAAALASVAVGGWGIKLAADVQSATTRFEVLTGSATKARNLVEEIRSLSDVTPLEAAPMYDTASALLAANEAAEDVTGTLKMLGDLSMGNQVKLDLLAKAYSDVKNKGSLQGQELRQFAENGVGMLPVLAMRMFGDATTANIKKVKELSEKGEISFSTVRSALEALTSEGGRFYRAMDEASKDFWGRWSTAKDMWSRFGAELGAELIPKAEKFVEFLILAGEQAQASLGKWKEFWTSEFGQGLYTTLSVLNPLMGILNGELDRMAGIKPSEESLLMRLVDLPFDTLTYLPDLLHESTGQMNEFKSAVNDQNTLTMLWKWFAGDPEQARLAKPTKEYLEYMAMRKREAQKEADAKEEAANKAAAAESEAIEKQKDDMDKAAKSIEDNMRKSRQAVEAMSNGWSEAMTKDMAILDDLVSKYGLSEDDPRIAELAQLMEQERELAEIAKERTEAEKQLKEATELAEKQTRKAQQAVEALSNGWSDEMAKDMAVLQDLQDLYGVDSSDPRVQELAQLMEKERQLTALEKERKEALKEKERDDEKARKEAEDYAKEIHEKYMTPTEKLAKEMDKLQKLRAANLINDKELKYAIEDLKEIERRTKSFDFGLSQEQIALMAGSAMSEKSQGMLTGYTLPPKDGQASGYAVSPQTAGAGDGGFAPGASQSPQGVTTPSASSDPLVPFVRSVANDVRQIYLLAYRSSQQPETVQVIGV